MSATWNWNAFQGSRSALRYAKRDLSHLVAAMHFAPGRRLALQAGGNLGIWPKRLAREFEAVVTCEPDPDNFAKLQANAPELNILAHPVALGATCGTVGLCKARRDGRPDSHEGCVHVAGEGDVPLRTIDSFGLPVCDLIYLDVEGYELYALHGARATLARCRPVVAVEINKHLRSYGLWEADIVTYMGAAGYTLGPQLGKDRVFLPRERAA